MTDQLEHDLRTMLASRARAVTADPGAGEQVIADRLRAGDDALADVLPLAARPSRRRWMAAAAVAVLVAGVAALIARDDAKVTLITPTDTVEPVIFTAPGAAEDVALAYLEDRLDVAAGAIDLRSSESIGAADAAGYQWTRTDVDEPSGGFVGLLLRDGRWAVLEAFSDGPSIDAAERDAEGVTVRTTAPTGTYVQLGIHRLTGEAITSGGCGGEAVGAAPHPPALPVECDLDEPIVVADDAPLTVRFSVVTQDGVRLTLEEQLLTVAGGQPTTPAEDPTVGRPGEAAKDVAERVALAAFGEEYVTTDVTEVEGDSHVTMEGPSGVVVAEVWPDPNGRGWQLVSIISPELAPLLEGGLGLATDGRLSVEVPVEGILTATGLDAALVPLGETAATRVEPGSAYELAVGPWLEEASWLRVSIVRADGDRLLLFGAA
jgi:hypothetical protein